VNIKKIKFNQKFLLPLIVLVSVAIIYLGKGLLVAAVVNGQPITRIGLIRELEKQGGAKTLDSLITKTLIMQEIKKQKVVVSQQEVDDEIKNIEQSLSSQGQNLDVALAAQGMTRKELNEQVLLQKQMEKIVGQNISVSEDEITKFITDNKDAFPEGSTEAQMKQTAKEQLTQQKLNDKLQAWLDELHAKAKILRFVNF
jgi:parvulin-like peptidyl-prolyl isomerase